MIEDMLDFVMRLCLLMSCLAGAGALAVLLAAIWRLFWWVLA